MRRLYPCTAVILALATGLLAGILLKAQENPAGAGEKPAADAAIERARSQVKMLDDLYKSYVVNITATYVAAEENIPAAKVTMKVFQSMHKKGWHKARLVDASGSPLRKANLPKTKFEKSAIAQIKNGTAYYDEIDSSGDQKVLRAATVVPVVMKQCITCHAGKKEGDLLGAIVYEIPIK